MKKKILIAIFVLCLMIFAKENYAIPPHPIITTSISEPTGIVNPQKVLEINFSINQSNQITLDSIAIKNLPEAVINPSNSDYYLQITDANNKVLYRSNILAVFDSTTNLSQQYYAIPYPSGAKYLYFFYQGQQIARYDVPQEFPWFYVIIGIVVVIALIAIYFISKKYTIQV